MLGYLLLDLKLLLEEVGDNSEMRRLDLGVVISQKTTRKKKRKMGVFELVYPGFVTDMIRYLLETSNKRKRKK